MSNIPTDVPFDRNRSQLLTPVANLQAPEERIALAMMQERGISKSAQIEMLKELRAHGWQRFDDLMTAYGLVEFWRDYVPSPLITHVGNGAKERNRRDEEKRRAAQESTNL